MIDLLYLSYDKDVPTDDYWDLGTINRLLEGRLWSAVGLPTFHRAKSFEDINGNGAVIVFPARRQLSYLKQLNDDLKRLEWVVLILAGDEAGEFPAKLIEHPNIRFWQMSPAPKTLINEQTRKIGSGVPPQGYDWLPQLKEDAENRPVDFFFAGQLTHNRRRGLKAELDTLDEFKENNHLEGVVHYSEGFTQGLPPEYYYKGLAASKVVPCPSGAINPESFRLFEALEAGCVPVVDCFSPEMEYTDFWTWFFGEEPPFPVYQQFSQIRGYITDSVDKYPALNNKVFAWWQSKKRQMAYWLVEDLQALGAPLTEAVEQNNITVIIPSSPIPSHPSTEMIEKTISDIRVHLPNAEILITVDGIREEQEHYRLVYDEYKKRLLWLANNQWHNVLPIIYEEHQHQARMARDVLELVKTPCILYAEHDTPLTPDRPIDWAACVKNILDGTANVIRFNHESKILDEHRHLILSDREEHHGIGLTKTQQWSQRPHIASTAFYKSLIAFNFNPESRTMIEDVIHQIVEVDMRHGGRQAWFNWRIWIYDNPDADGSILRSYNLDGRQANPKFDMDIKPVEGK